MAQTGIGCGGRRFIVTADHPKYIYWNDRLVAWDDATVHVTSIAWSAIGAVFEGIRGYWNPGQQHLHVFRLTEHLDRLRDSSKVVRLPLAYGTPELREIVIDLLKENECREDTYIFPLVFAGDAESNRYDPNNMRPELTIRTRPMPSQLSGEVTYHARTSSWTRISDTVMPPRIKNISNYRNGQLATHEVKQDGYDVAFMLNPQGKVAEAPGACVAMISKGKLVTPDVTSGILQSITRDAVITLARNELGLDVEERPVERTELYLANEVFTCGTAAEITPVVSVDKFPVGDGQIGATTRELRRLLADIVYGREDKYAAWRTSVNLALATV
jgi:branched-chain amino acid aminotransferase